MKRYFIRGDNVFSLDGIRAVQKSDSYNQYFFFTVTYKGNHFTAKFESRVTRDDAFEDLCEEIEKRNHGKEANKNPKTI